MKVYYDEAVDFLEENGISCDPGTSEGDCACNLLDDYAMDFLLPDKIRAQTYFEACEKAGDSLEESLKSNKELSEYNDELIAENIELHGKILELSDEIKTGMTVRAGLVKECDETYSELQSEKASYAAP